MTGFNPVSFSFLLLGLVITGYLIYYLSSEVKKYNSEPTLKPLNEIKVSSASNEKDTQKKTEPTKVKKDTIPDQETKKQKETETFTEKIDIPKTIKSDSIPVDPPVTTPAPTIRDKGKMYVINPNLPKICIIVDDFGNTTNTLFDRFNSLDKEVTFAILPGLKNSKSNMMKAVESGREVIIHMPMEPDMSNGRVKQQDLEKNTLMLSMTDFEIKNIVESWMYELFLAVGANNHMGSNATSDKRLMHTVLSTLKQNDMFFIDSYTSNNSIVSEIAKELGIKTAKRSVFLDVPDSSLKNARNKIEFIKKTFSKNDIVVVITHCHTDVKYRQLVHFIDRLKDEGYQLISVSDTVK